MFKIHSEIFNFGASMAQPVQARVRAVLKENALLQANVESLADDADLYAAGLTSHATVNLMLALEEAFDIEFPDRLLRRRTFSKVNAVAQAADESGLPQEAALLPGSPRRARWASKLPPGTPTTSMRGPASPRRLLPP